MRDAVKHPTVYRAAPTAKNDPAAVLGRDMSALMSANGDGGPPCPHQQCTATRATRHLPRGRAPGTSRKSDGFISKLAAVRMPSKGACQFYRLEDYQENIFVLKT